MSALDLRVLVLERRWKLWEESLAGQPPVAGTGVAGRLAYWTSLHRVAAAEILHWDTPQGRLGIGTATPTAPLTFAATLGQKIHLWTSGLYRYGLGVASQQLQVFGDPGSTVALGHMSATDGTTFTAAVTASASGVSITKNTGIGYGASGNLWLNCGTAYFDSVRAGGGQGAAAGYQVHVPDGVTWTRYLAVNRAAPTPGYWDSSLGFAVADRLRLPDAAQARWALDCIAPAHIAQLGVYYAPPTAVWLRTASAAFDSLSLARGEAAPRWGLDCEGSGYIGRLGVSAGPAANGYLYNPNLTNLGVTNMGYGDGTAGHMLQVNGYAYFASGIGCNIAPQTNWAIYTSGNWCKIGGVVGINGQPGGNYSLEVNNTLGTTYLACTYLMGVGGGWDSRWNFINWGTSYFNNTCQFQGVTGFGYAPDGNYWIRSGALYADSILSGSTLRCYTTFVSHAEAGFQREAAPGWAIAAGNSIHCTSSVAQKIGGGPWGDSSSRSMKRNIAAIPNALDLLLAQRGRQYEWEEPVHASRLPGLRYGLVLDEVTIPQWLDPDPSGGDPLLTPRGFEALVIEALRQLTTRLAALEEHC